MPTSISWYAENALYSIEYRILIGFDVMSGVPRILENTLPPHLFADRGEEQAVPDWSVYEEYLRTTRININVRQVFPKGFNPQLQ